MKKLIFPLVAMSSLSSFAINEADVYTAMKNRFESTEYCAERPVEMFWKRMVVQTPKKAFKGARTYNLRYSKFGCTLGKKGAILVSPGRSEGSPEYYETAIDYVKDGYSPVYVIDHRGQGLSPRELPNTYKGHVANFDDYVSDLKYAVTQIEKDLQTLGFKKGETPFYFTSNSMGSAIGLGYFQTMGDKTPFTAAALLGSMIRVNYLSYIDKDAGPINDAIYSEAGVIAQGTVNCLTKKKCARYARPEVFGDYKPGTRNYVYSDSEKEMEEYMTHSKSRYDLRTFLWDEFDWSDIIAEEYKGENWTGPQLGGSTFSWTLYSTKFLINMRKRRSIKKMPDMPILLMTGTRDLRAYKPYKDGSTDLSRHSGFCDSVNKSNRFNKKLCTFYPLKDSFHEIYKESDLYRNKALNVIKAFFEENQ